MAIKGRVDRQSGTSACTKRGYRGRNLITALFSSFQGGGEEGRRTSSSPSDGAALARIKVAGSHVQ